MINIINLAGAHDKNSLTNHFMGNRKKSERNYIEELVDVMEYLVVLKREVYTLSFDIQGREKIWATRFQSDTVINNYVGENNVTNGRE